MRVEEVRTKKNGLPFKVIPEIINVLKNLPHFEISDGKLKIRKFKNPKDNGEIAVFFDGNNAGTIKDNGKVEINGKEISLSDALKQSFFKHVFGKLLNKAVEISKNFNLFIPKEFKKIAGFLTGALIASSLAFGNEGNNTGAYMIKVPSYLSSHVYVYPDEIVINGKTYNVHEIDNLKGSQALDVIRHLREGNYEKQYTFAWRGEVPVYVFDDTPEEVVRELERAIEQYNSSMKLARLKIVKLPYNLSDIIDLNIQEKFMQRYGDEEFDRDFNVDYYSIVDINEQRRILRECEEAGLTNEEKLFKKLEPIIERENLGSGIFFLYIPKEKVYTCISEGHNYLEGHVDFKYDGEKNGKVEGFKIVKIFSDNKNKPIAVKDYTVYTVKEGNTIKQIEVHGVGNAKGKIYLVPDKSGENKRFKIILHEMGHALGLAHPDTFNGNNCPSFDTVMDYCISENDNALSDMDKKMLEYLYSKSSYAEPEAEKDKSIRMKR